VLVLRNAVRNQRWPETWQAYVTQRQAVRRHRRAQRTDRWLRLTCWAVLIPLTRWRRSTTPPPPAQRLTLGDRLFSDAHLLRAIAIQKLARTYRTEKVPNMCYTVLESVYGTVW
jgi:hypothetical protein